MRILTKIPLKTKKLQAEKKFCQYHVKCSQFMNKYNTLKALIKEAKSNKSKCHRKGEEIKEGLQRKEEV